MFFFSFDDLNVLAYWMICILHFYPKKINRFTSVLVLGYLCIPSMQCFKEPNEFVMEWDQGNILPLCQSLLFSWCGIYTGKPTSSLKALAHVQGWFHFKHACQSWKLSFNFFTTLICWLHLWFNLLVVCDSGNIASAKLLCTYIQTRIIVGVLSFRSRM